MASTELYLRFFEFSERPFTLVPDPSFLFWSKQHKRAYSILEFGILSSAPVTLITGEIGAGKTTLIQRLLGEVQDEVTIGLVSNAQGGRGELLQWILNALSIPMAGGASYVEMFQTLQDYLLEKYADGQRVILIFDEAQNLSLEGLEELRMLTNINSGKDVLLQLVLSGQPELREMVSRPSMQQLAQRIAASFHLTAMNAETVAKYIQHRLRMAGGSGQEFSPEACALIHAETGGIPRLVNQLAEFALMYAWSDDQHQIDEGTVQQVLKDNVFFRGYQRPEEPLVLFQGGRDRDG